ncbi:hypothetical protein PG993_007884 [Apiospora rasikravindrae]|uniref:Uncharacterized protein n=1 Tax=Apiospora rasikravindrae TaxID=990691 RepID=A0ABR1SYS1_9PEZI
MSEAEEPGVLDDLLIGPFKQQRVSARTPINPWPPIPPFSSKLRPAVRGEHQTQLHEGDRARNAPYATKGPGLPPAALGAVACGSESSSCPPHLVTFGHFNTMAFCWSSQKQFKQPNNSLQ